jgi:transposase
MCCRRRSNADNLFSFPGAVARRPRGSRVAFSDDSATRTGCARHGSSLRRGETRQLAINLGDTPKENRVNPWEYDRVLYKRRNEVERLFRRLKGFRRIFSRFEKLDVMFVGFIHFVLIVEALRLLC